MPLVSHHCVRVKLVDNLFSILMCPILVHKLYVVRFLTSLVALVLPFLLISILISKKVEPQDVVPDTRKMKTIASRKQIFKIYWLKIFTHLLFLSRQTSKKPILFPQFMPCKKNRFFRLKVPKAS